jgi:uncharacterized protein YajQ (UPF0234 family)
MASYSFDVTTGCDLQEVDNAINQASKELTQRFDFRGVDFTIDFKRKDNLIALQAPDDMKLKAIWDVVQTKMVKRKVPIRNLHPGDVEDAFGSSVKQTVSLQQGIPGDTAKKIVKFLKDKKLKKVQSSIQGDQVRVVSPSKDSLQEVMDLLRGEDFGIELEFGNYR